jgi:hypothetical protein
MLLAFFVVGALSAVSGAAGSTPGEFQNARCIRQGLAPISVDVRVSVRDLPDSSTPYLHIGWSGPPIPAACRLDRSVAADEGESLGYIRSVWGRLRYQVLTPGGVVLAQRVRSTPAHYSRCPKKPRMKAGRLRWR